MRIVGVASIVLTTLLIGKVNAAPLDQPTPEVVAEARSIVQEMIANQRGPYSRIRWYCNDGTTQAPVSYACRDHGGGRQHAEYSTQRQRLVELGWSVGTIFASLTFEELFGSAPRQQRLRELALEKYLVDIDNGWILQNARGYRGRVQVEDEEVAGRKLLNQTLEDSVWLQENFLLVRESARVIPHGEETDLSRKVRRAAIEMAELDFSAERWRAEIHSSPSAATANSLRTWLKAQPRPAIADIGEKLAEDLDRLYGSSGRRERITSSLSQLSTPAASANWRSSVVEAMALPPTDRIKDLCFALADARENLMSLIAATNRLALVDAMQELESEVQLTYQEVADGMSMSRADTLRLGSSLINCAYGSGLLSATERASLTRDLDVYSARTLSIADYKSAIARLKRAPNWAVGTIRHTFAEPLIRYTALEPKASRFSDDLLRGSPMWILGDILKILSRDLDYVSGSVVQMNGGPVATAVALNGGVARGSLRIFETIEAIESATLLASDIVVLPETVAELAPVAGILTLGEGNALSHVQLLARNFGIPNVAIDQDTVDLLRPLENQEIILVVDNDGNVILQSVDAATVKILSGPATNAEVALAKIAVPSPNLTATSILPLAEIGRELSGKVIGPKAANLGELNRLFPGRVAPAVAVPFGVYAEHLVSADLMNRIRSIFAAGARGDISKADVDAALAEVRKNIAELKLSDEKRAELSQKMHEAFGEPGTYGVFVRSDTNVEDLPQFTGAGLNETVPNVVGLEAQFAAIPRVWSSVFSPRALAWRSNVLSNPEQIYASVLLMKSVAATKSGVLVTANLFDRGAPGLTASTAWGVGGAVAGEPAESVVIGENSAEVFSEAKSPYQRSISASGGVGWIPAAAGPVLVEQELALLRELASEVNDKYAPVYDDNGNARPWDIEFGFVDGDLTLFQIRPLVERGNRNASAILRQLQPTIGTKSARKTSVALDQRLGNRI